MIMLEDVTEYITSKNLAKTANDFSKGSVSYSVHLAELQTKASAESKDLIAAFPKQYLMLRNLSLIL